MRELQKLRVRRARENFGYFNDCFRYPPPQFDPAPMHRRWEEILQDAYGKYHKILLLAGRGSAKSERVTINYTSWIIGRFNDLRISLVSNPASKSESFLSKITLRVEEDEFYREVFGNLKPVNPKVWRNDAITLKRDIMSKDPSISAVGVMGQAVSKRADVIIMDDPLDSENTRTKHQRESLIKWYNEALDPILEPHGLIIAIMTPWHEEDLSQYLLKQPGWFVLQSPAIVDPEVNFDTWLDTDDSSMTAWPEKYGYKVQEIDYNGNPLFDENNEPRMISFLMSKYRANVDAFMSQYLLNPFSKSGTIFDYDWVTHFSTKELQSWLPNLVGYQGWDLAVSLDTRADYTACATVAHDVITNKIHILDVVRAKITPLEQFQAVQEQFHRWNPSIPIRQITIEADQYQAALSMGLIAATTLPIIESKSKGKRKLDRIALLAPHFQNGRIDVAEHLTDGVFEAEYKRFPKTAKDDQLDALHKACEPILGQSAEPAFFIDSVDIRPPDRGITDINQLIRWVTR